MERTLRYENDLDGLVPMMREFRDSIAERREPLTSGAAGLDDLSVVLKAYESMSRGASLSMD
jgi:predicted dehydrogenase